MRINLKTFRYLLWTLILASTLTPALAQDVIIPDPGLDAAIRDALAKPVGPLTERDLLSLIVLDASKRNVSSIAGLEEARNLVSLELQGNRLTNFSLPNQLTNLASLNLSSNPMTNCFLPNGLTNLTKLIIEGSSLTHLTLPSDLTGLIVLDLGDNQLTGLNLPAGLTNLNQLVLTGNQLTNLTLPPDLTQLVELDLAANPLTSLVLSEPLAATTDLTATLDLLRSQGVAVITYSLTIQLILPRLTATGAFDFALIGPPGVYTVQGSADLVSWSDLDTLTNTLGVARFEDATVPLSPRKFFRARVTP